MAFVWYIFDMENNQQEGRDSNLFVWDVLLSFDKYIRILHYMDYAGTQQRKTLATGTKLSQLLQVSLLPLKLYATNTINP